MHRLERSKILEVIENYCRYIKNKNDLEKLAHLFAERVYWHVFSTGSGAWNEKHAETRAEVKQMYAYFHKNIQAMDVTYTNFIVDEVNNRLAFLVLVRGINADGTHFNMENSVELQLNEDYQITRFLNWYGTAPDRIFWPK